MGPLLSKLTHFLKLSLPIFFLLYNLLTCTSATVFAAAACRLWSSSPIMLLLTTMCILSVFFYFLSAARSRPVLLLGYSCFKPDDDRKTPYDVCESFVRRTDRFAPESIDFMRNIYLKSGLGDETYAPPFIFGDKQEADLGAALHEAHEGVFSSVDSLLRKTNVNPLDIDVVIVTCGGFSPSPSISSAVVNRYRLKPDVKTYNLSGMGCSSGVLSVDLASKLLRSSRGKVLNALVVVTESVSLNWYYGDSRPMLVTNCIFRVGCAAMLLTNDPTRRRVAKMELLRSLRTHHGADDSSYKAAFQEEDDKGITGISLTKDLIRVAGANLRDHIKILAPRVLPLSQLLSYAYSASLARLSGADAKPPVPDFTTAFEQICIHTGGKAVIRQVGRIMRLSEAVTEPARMSLHRFGNTSSSLLMYELAYVEAKGRLRSGDRVWMVAFGTGFKVGSLVWRSLRDGAIDGDNPWRDCIDRYPLKAW